MLVRIGGIGVFLLLVAAPASGQEPTPKSATTVIQRLDAPAPVSLETVPRLLPDQRAQTAVSSNTIVQPGVTRGQSVALMIAGGALFVAGAIVGGDAGTLLMVGGAAIGAYGLYLHFR